MTPDNAPSATCYCGRFIAHDGRWKHTNDGSTFCYPDDPRDGEMRAEPDPYAGVLDAD